jgi:3-methyladenine DNA glycosylase AlkD
MVSRVTVLSMLTEKANPGNLVGMARFGITVKNRLGTTVADMRKIAKAIGRNHRLALELWKTGIAEARIVASMMDDPDRVTTTQAERWVRDFNSWDVCDQVCQNLFIKTPWVWQKIWAWTDRDEEYVKRAGYALIATLASHAKDAPDARFIQLFPILKRGAADERNFVKKAVSWALRNIGKRNRSLNQAALALAREIQRMDSRAARWVATDVLRELASDTVRRRLNKQHHASG